MMRLALMSLLVGCLSVAGCGGDDEEAGGDASSAAPSFLTVIEARGGTLSGDGDSLDLTLRGVGSQVVAFSDRPERISGAIETSSFIDGWAMEYEGDPPNAALTLLAGREGADTLVLALEQPRRSGSELRFRAQEVGSPGEGLEHFDELSDPSLPERFGAASLFIDAGGLMQLVAYGAQDVYLTG